MALQRTWNVFIYRQDGVTLVKSLSTQVPVEGSRGYLKAPPSFHSSINGGQGQCVLDLGGPEFLFDGFGEGTAVAFMNVVDVYEVGANNPLGKRIYRGLISRYEPYVQGNSDEGVKVTCLGLVSLLSFDHFRSGSSYTVSYSGGTAADPSKMATDVIDQVNAVYGGSLFSYSAASVGTVGAASSYTFTDKKWLDAVNSALLLAGSGWWWFIDQDGVFSFKPRPTVATHSFTLGRDVDSIQGIKNAEKITNAVQVRYTGGGVYDASDAASQAAYGTGSPATGRRSVIITDSNILTAGSATQRATTELSNFENALVGGVVVVNMNYDLETIRVGDTCRILNQSKDSVFFTDNMQIASLDYRGETVSLQLEEQSTRLGHTLNNFFGRQSGVFTYG